MRTFLITASLLFTLLLRAQDAKEILEKSVRAIDGLEKTSYHVDICQTNILSGDTNRFAADCSLKRIPSDTIAGMYYFFSTGNQGFYKYNGNAFYSYSPEYYNFIIRLSVKDNPERFRSTRLPNGSSAPEVTSISYYIFSLFKSVTEINSILDETSADKPGSGVRLKVISDTLVDGVKCCGIRLDRPKKNFSYSKLILVDRHTYLPVAVIKDFRGGSVSLNRENIAVGQYTSVKYSKIKSSAPRFDYLMGDKSLPKEVEINDNLPVSEPFKIGDQAPGWLLPEMKTGRFVSSDSLAGKIIVLDFTSTWCIHGLYGAEVMKELRRKYNDRKDLLFINVFSSTADTREKVQKYANDHGLEGICLYNASVIEKKYGILSYPNFFLVDRHGRIAYFQRNYSTELFRNLLRQIDDCLLKK